MRTTSQLTRLAVAVLLAAMAASCATDVATVKKMTLAKDPADAPALRAALGARDPIARRLAIYGLERIGDPANASAIWPLLNDRDEWVRRNAATALGKLRNRAATPYLVNALDHPDVHLRYEAFIALARIGDPAAQKPIIRAMQDKRLWRELGAWDEVAVLHVIDRDWWTDRDVIPFLKGLLDYDKWDHPEFAELDDIRRTTNTRLVANKAAEVLATKFGDASGEDWLIKGLAADDYMQQTSAYALGLLKSRKAVPALTKLFESEWLNNRRYAIEALAAIGDKSAVPALEKMLEQDDLRIRTAAAAALVKIDGVRRAFNRQAPTAATPPAEAVATPGDKRPPQLICLGVDDCVNIEGMESILDIVETLREHDAKVVFTLWVAPLASDYESRDMVKQKLIYQRLFDLGTEIANHTLHHNPGGHNWHSLKRPQQVEEIEGATQWYRDNIDGFTRPFTYKGGGGGHGAAIDRDFSNRLIARQKFLYWGRRGQHPNVQRWPFRRGERASFTVETGCLDAAAPPVHATITDKITSDYPGRFDFDMGPGVAMWKANFEYHYNLPHRPVLGVNAFHDWGFKTQDDSTAKGSHRNEAALLKAFLLDVLVKNKDKYPDTHCVTFRQVVEYANTNGDLKQTLAIGNGQDSRNPVKPSIE